MEENPLLLTSKSWYKKFYNYYFFHKKKIWSIGVVILFIILGVYFSIAIQTPTDFPIGNVVTVQPGSSLQEISNQLKYKKIINSVFIFRTTAIILGGERKIIAGDYLLDKRENSITLAFRFIKGLFHIEQIKVTIPEGWTISQIADYLESKLPKLIKKYF